MKRTSVAVGTRCDEFDLVTCNPPLLPIPAGVEYPFVGDGGEDGLAVTRALIRCGARRLSNVGRIQVIGCGFHDRSQSDLRADLSEIAHQYDLNLSLLIAGGFDFYPGSMFFDKMVCTAHEAHSDSTTTIREGFERLAEERGSRIVSFLAEFGSPQSVRPSCIDFSERDTDGWFL